MSKQYIHSKFPSQHNFCLGEQTPHTKKTMNVLNCTNNLLTAVSFHRMNRQKKRKKVTTKSWLCHVALSHRCSLAHEELLLGLHRGGSGDVGAACGLDLLLVVQLS
jgi:hypothetical protein